MKCFRSAATLVLLAAPAPWAVAAPPTVTIPTDQLKPVNGYVKFTPGGDAKAVTYVGLSGAYPLPAEELKDPRRFMLPVAGLKSGRYEFVAVGSLNDEHTTIGFSVLIGDDPGPKPPDPKPPPDPPPAPDALTRQLQAAYDADPAPDKGERMAVFADVMAEAVKMCNNPQYTTNAELVQAIKTLTTSKVANSLSGVRAEVGRYLNAKLPAGVVQLDTARRSTFVEHYGAVAKACKAVKR